MPRDITITFEDGATHVYKNAPDDITPDQASQRASQEFGRAVTALDGGRKSSAPDKQPEGGGMLERAIERGRQSPEAALLAGAGKGFGDAMLGAQHWVGKGAGAIGLDGAGKWLVDDAAAGRAKIAGELADYKAREPAATGIGELTGNIAATVPVVGQVGKGVGLLAPNIGKAVATGGMQGGSMATRMVGGGAAGGLAAGMVDPESAGTGALIGAAFPPVIKGAGELGGLLGRMARPVIASVSDDAANKIAVSKMRDAIGEKNIVNAVGDIQTYYPKGAESIPVSASGITKSADLARVEQASRLRRPAEWHAFDQKQGGAVYDNVLQATREADDLAARFAKRAENWAENWAKAEKGVKPRVFAQRMGALYGDLQQAKSSPEAVNPAVRGVFDQVESTLMSFGDKFSPAHLQQLRAEFNGKIKPMAASAIKSAPRDNPAIKSLISELDDILNRSTGNKWDRVRQGYAEDTASVHASKAAAKVRESFVDSSGMIKGKALDNDTPKITETGLWRAINSARKDDGTLALSDLSLKKLSATLDAIRNQNFMQNVKGSTLGGGGSDTVSNLGALGASQMAPTPLLRALSEIKSLGTARTDREIAMLLQNPDELAKLLSQQPKNSVRLNQLTRGASRVAPLTSSDR